ncbi:MULTISPECIES: tripartite tricarboxylate transporter substrate binding protein [unclassified Variovorax]|uniref:Bug family tripartite tricarboxylate transporter substrate binding protein n=1 Tax=unclassified Variovorax TaxID=663243 RepID=UPI00076D271D|nr:MULTISPECIES: tripartite tricarboxylate transporter substrate binding protein [unclassified Variovorax]KWT97676.1 Uncharacterized protein UPF0065 [Variovorax sp. WDL1]
MALALVGVHGAHAQPVYPAKPIRLLVNAAPGSGGDSLARLLAEKLARELNGTVVVENKPGAGGTIAMDMLTRAAPDGYTLGLGSHSTHILGPASSRHVPYDPVKDFTPIGKVGSAATLLIAVKDYPADNLDEVVALSKRSKEPLQYASWGNGSSGHFCGELLNYRFKLGMAHIPYKSVAQIQTDLIGGHVKLAFVDMGTGTAMVKGGKAKAVASCGDRSPSLPEVASYSDLDVDVAGKRPTPPRWTLYAPARTPAAVSAPLAKALRATVESPEVKAWMLNQGIVPGFIEGEKVREMNREDLIFWTGVAKAANIVTD